MHTTRVVVLHQGRVQDMTKGGAHAYAQIIDGCGLSYCTCAQSWTAERHVYTAGL